MSDSTSDPAPNPGVTRSKVRYRPLSHTTNRPPWKVIAISSAAAVIGGAAFLTFASIGARERMESRGFVDRTLTLEPEQSWDYHLTSLIGGVYDLDVSAHEGPVIMACGMLEKGDVQEIDPADVARIVRNGVFVVAGRRHRLTGNYHRGKFFWTVINPSKDKRVDVTVKFGS